MNISDELASRIARPLAEDAIERVEAQLGIDINEDRWADICQTLEADFAEAIQEAFNS